LDGTKITTYWDVIKNVIEQKATGGVVGDFKRLSSSFINSGSGLRDDVAAMLTKGEFVMKASSVAKYGRSFFESLNSGVLDISGYATGGLVDSLRGIPLDSGAFGNAVDSSSTSTYNVNIGNGAFPARGKVASLSEQLLAEVRRRY